MATAAELASLRERIANILTTDPCQRIQFNVPGFSFRPGAFMVIGVSLKFSDVAHSVPGYRGRPMHVSVVRMPAHTWRCITRIAIQLRFRAPASVRRRGNAKPWCMNRCTRYLTISEFD